MPSEESANAGLPRWGIVATVDEPAALLAAWVAHHLALGASELHLFFDRPNPEAEALLDGIDGVILHHSGEDGWQGKRGKRPGHHVERQCYNATQILNEADLDWLVHCDADEFLRLDAPLEEELARQPPAVQWVRLTVEERVWTGTDPDADIFAGAFRLPLVDFAQVGPALYGEGRAGRLNSGLTGHDVGKACVRVGRGHVMKVHRPASSNDVKRSDLRHRRGQTVRLMHFNGMTRLHYIMKMLRRGLVVMDGQRSPNSLARKMQFASAIAGATDPEVLTGIWREMQSVSPKEQDILKELDAITYAGTQIAAETHALFGDRIDLSPAAFDRAIVAHEAAGLAQMRQRIGFDPAPLMARDG